MNYASREDWQRALWQSKWDPVAKQYLKQLENTVVDGWDKSFEKVWERIEETLDRGLPITDEVFIEYLTDSARHQVKNLNVADFSSAFNGLYLRGKDKADLSNGKGKKKAQRIDSLEEQAQLARLLQTSLSKVTSITSADLKAEILEALSRPGAAAKNPTAIANEIIRSERAKLEEAIDDRKKLREEIKKLYDQQSWKVLRICRTEGANSYTLSVLSGYLAQGIKTVKFNSHTKEQRTCSTCLSLAGTEHDIETLLGEGGRYPLSHLTHPNCRCFFDPVLQHVTLESMEKMYEDSPDLFAPGQTVFDRAQLEMEDVVKLYQEHYGVELHDVPVEHEEDVKEALGVIRETPYQQYQPDALRFVKDVGATPEFQKAVELPEPVLGQVTAWTSPANELLISQFSSDDGNTVSAAVLRSWAAKIYDETADVRRRAKDLYERDEVRPNDISPKTIRALLKTFEPFTCMREQLVGSVETVALEKRFREASDDKLEKVLTGAGVSAKDRKTLLAWRQDRPVWTMEGVFVPAEGLTGSSRNRFVNRVAEQGSRECFIESTASYIEDPHTLSRRDPELYGYLRDEVFRGKEFKNR